MADTNPHASPATGSATRTSAELYSPGHVTRASFLGLPVAGCVLLAINYRCFGNVAAANVAFAAGFFGTASFLVVVVFFYQTISRQVSRQL